MVTAWDKYQELVKEEMRRVYSEAVVDHAMNPRNVGNLEVVDGYASVWFVSLGFSGYVQCAGTGWPGSHHRPDFNPGSEVKFESRYGRYSGVETADQGKPRRSFLGLSIGCGLS